MQKIIDRKNELGKIIDQDNEKQFLTNFERMRIVKEYCKLVGEIMFQNLVSTK